ncbi:MAG: FAD:protein FMN transferase [Patescibacteria group bacterium]|nr:FAD:protein FMN transferase [Patescibacteria group bacterium]
MDINNFTFEATGTVWQIDIYDPVSKKIKAKISDLVKSEADNFEKKYSRFRDDSWLRKISRLRQKSKLPKDAKTIFDLYQNLYKITNGIFTPLIGSFMEESGYDSNYSLIPKISLHHPPTWKNAIEYNYPYIQIKQNVVIDFGAAGKGYLIDIIKNLLKDNQINSFCIDAGGDIYVNNHPTGKMQIGLENPKNLSEVIGIIYLNNASICASSGNRRRWDKFHHIINPQTLSSPTDIIATWTIAQSALIADAMSTCLFLVDKSILQNAYNFDYLILKKDFSFEKSSGFEAELFLKN